MEDWDVIASWAALLLSLVVAVGAAIRTSRDKTDGRISQLEGDVVVINAHRERLRGANMLDRLSSVETRQRADETALVRVEERLQSVDRSLELLCEEIRRADGRQQ